MCFAMWHDPEFKEANVDAEAGVYLKQPIEAHGGVQVRELPACTAASAIHAGSYRRLQEAYDALLRWVGSNGYQVAGPIRELYLQNSQPVRQDDESYVTEIQVPVSKTALPDVRSGLPA
jgi:effector-binding domain-containing protein